MDPQPLIEAYTHCPRCGSPDYDRAEGRRCCRGCGFTDFNNPVVAVAVWILDARDRLLLIERAKDPGKGKLAPPGGFVDIGESLEEAAIREVFEETNVRIEALSYLCSAPNGYTFGGCVRPVCDVFFVARVDQFNVTPEAKEVRHWQQREIYELRVEELAFPSMQHAYIQLLPTNN